MRLAVRNTPISYVDQHQSGANFLALRDLFNRLPSDRAIDILDLGPAWNANIEFFSQFRSRVYIEDLFRWMQRNGNTQSHQTALESLQTYPQDTKFDVILFWDLFDYLNAKQAEALITHLRSYCKKGTLLFFVSSTMDVIPRQPASFKILDAEHLLYETTTTETMEGKGHRQATIHRMLPGFKMVRAFRMSNGVEENLYIYE